MGAAEGGVGYSCVLPLTDAFSVLGLMVEETTDLSNKPRLRPWGPSLRVAGQEGGVSLSFEQIIKRIKEGIEGVEGKKTLLMAESK